MEVSSQILSEITVYMKYAKFLPNKEITLSITLG